MGHPYVLGGAAFPCDDMPFQSQPCGGLQDGLQDSSMRYIDPNMQNPASSAFDGTSWAAPAQQSFKENAATFFVVDPASQVSDHGAVRPAVSVSQAPVPYARYGSPFSSAEPSPPGAGLSPPADTESYYDGGYPRTPSEANLLSPFQPPLPMEPFAHAVQFRSMGPGPDYVKLCDVSPGQQHSEYCESDNDMFDFNFAPQPAYFSGHVIRDVVPASHGAAVPEPELSDTQPGLDETQSQSVVKEEIKVESQYPPLEDDAGPEKQPGPKRRQQHGNDDEDDDGGRGGHGNNGDLQYRPSKRRRTTSRIPEQHAAKTIPAAASLPRATRTRAGNPIPPPPRSGSSLSGGKARLACPDCKQRAFASRADLDSHVKKEHRRPFSCVFDFAGCNSTFGSKNEWKRHVATQHLLLNYWVCTEGVCAKVSQDHPPSPDQHQYAAAAATTTTTTTSSSSSTTEGKENPRGAIFNRKDLFTQHLKRMHAPKEVKELLPQAASKRAGTSSARGSASANSNNNNNSNNKMSTAQESAILARWAARVKRLQDAAVRPRCRLPTFMRCPFPGCASAPPFRGNDAWNRRMEHVARHMNSPGNDDDATNNNNNKTRRVGCGSGGDSSSSGVPVPAPDPTLVEWAARPDVAIIVPDGRGGWVLKSPLERKPGGNVVVTAPAGHASGDGGGGGGGGGGGHDAAEGGGEEEEGEKQDEDYDGEDDDEEDEEEEVVVVEVMEVGLGDEEQGDGGGGGEDDEAEMDAEGEDDDD
ncbi:hypothetical protein MYCTH_2300382 [Thermothelomyces thermophilus ATCC 42464]|uniref:C2H2-type domain-containing protein n=1 Tax=Thermothelomyces thermophilus (strain ATCC 42464 / BCRC 31852 / DSM 1799) TaxID=573729 RepID=G2QB52_THET4|nr:uncharacterized protein MYCTH_2300382 [Thermothelomyces thermophilus ATCC 42464]AEO55990.1 hypothetical protein MYCTH_2300382 [Thermothelomyces thermophilus ATCC 42464]